jgi:hypothetical protein
LQLVIDYVLRVAFGWWGDARVFDCPIFSRIILWLMARMTLLEWGYLVTERWRLDWSVRCKIEGIEMRDIKHTLYTLEVHWLDLRLRSLQAQDRILPPRCSGHKRWWCWQPYSYFVVFERSASESIRLRGLLISWKARAQGKASE